jgi:hypothetical protein
MSGLFSDPEPPKPADVVGAAKATASGNQNAAVLNQYGNMVNQVGPEQSTYTKDANGNYTYTPSGTNTGVAYTPYTQDIDPKSATYGQMIEAKRNDRGDLPFNMAGLTDKQKADYYAGKGLPKNFNMTYDPLAWSQAQKLGINDQQLFNESQAAQLQLSGLGLTGLDAVRNAVDPKAGYTNAEGKFISTYNGDIAPTLSVMGGPKSTTDFMVGPKSTTDFMVGPKSTTDFMTSNLNTGNISSSVANAGGITKSADPNISAAMSVANNQDKLVTSSGATEKASGLGATSNNADKISTSLGLDPKLLTQGTTDALYEANKQYLDPQFAQAQSKLESQLANQGITRGSEAYNNAMLNFNNQKQQAYTDARNQAIGQGTAAAQGMFGMGLQSAQFGNTALGQQFGQNVTAQQLANASAQQNNQNAQVNMGLTNQAYGQQFGQNLQAGQFGNAAVAQNNQQYINAGNFANAAQAQQYSQNLSNLQAANTAETQAFGMNLQNANLKNQVKDMEFNQNLQSNQLTNQVKDTLFNQNLRSNQLTNQVKDTLFNQNLQSNQLTNQASNQQLAQNQAIQQNPLNILQALRTGAQLNTANLPAVGVSQPGQLANWQGADFLGAAQAQNQFNQGQYNAQMASNAQLRGSVIGAGGALGGAAIASDRRLKKNIKRIGTHVLGIGLYTWDYLWGQPFSGVMADEVEQVMPEAIVMHPSGFKMVNYEMLGLL